MTNPAPMNKAAEPEFAYLYLMAGRKAWHHDVPAGWTEIAWERFNHVECGIFRKPVAELAVEDKDDWLLYHSDTPDDWIQPSYKEGFEPPVSPTPVPALVSADARECARVSSAPPPQPAPTRQAPVPEAAASARPTQSDVPHPVEAAQPDVRPLVPLREVPSMRFEDKEVTKPVPVTTTPDGEWITYAEAAKLRGCSDAMISLLATKNGRARKRDQANPRRLLVLRADVIAT